MTEAETIKQLVSALEQVSELIEGYEDVKDGDYGVPEANDAMRAQMVISQALKRGYPWA